MSKASKKQEINQKLSKFHNLDDRNTINVQDSPRIHSWVELHKK